MGIKERARAMMQRCGVPILPGSEGVLGTDEEAFEIADKIGYPVILKASAGGGGRGMRVVNWSLRVAVLYWRRPSRKPARRFAAPDVYLEKFIRRRRATSNSRCSPIEHGNVEILGERECSIQRRHQKLLEESPSPVLQSGCPLPRYGKTAGRHSGHRLQQCRHGRVSDG